MHLHRLPYKKKVTVQDLLIASDKNEAKQSVMQAIEGAIKDSRRTTSIFIIAEVEGQSLVTHAAGFSNAEIVFIAEMMKASAMRDHQVEGNEYDEEDENG